MCSSDLVEVDGLHFDRAINEPPYVVVDSLTAEMLHAASDHLPVIAELEWPGKNIK